MYSDNQRKIRGLHQKLFLIEVIDNNKKLEFKYIIMGSTGNVYQVCINNKPFCNCPDYKQRKNRCKHIYFVLIRIMNVIDPDQEFYSNNELLLMFKNIPNVTNYLKISDDLKKNYDSLKNKKISEKDLDDACPICLDDLLNDEKLITCKFSCGKHVHFDCYNMYNKNKLTKDCIYCKYSLDQEKYVNITNLV